MVTAAGERRKGRREESLMVANVVVNLGRTSPGEHALTPRLSSFGAAQWVS